MTVDAFLTWDADAAMFAGQAWVATLHVAAQCDDLTQCVTRQRPAPEF
jgi:hypothetical protein